MSTYAAAATISGPSAERHEFLKRTALWTLGGLTLAAVVGTFSTFFIAPLFMGIPFAGTGIVLATFFLAHWGCRRMVYGSAAVPGFLIACLAEGVSFGFLLLTVLLRFGFGSEGLLLVGQALFLTAATAGGMLAYVWFAKTDLSLVKAFLSMAFVPMLILMAVGVFFPIGGTLGLIISAVFVLVSAGGLLYRLNYVVHELDTEQHVPAAYEITMGVLVLLWNMINLLSRLRR